MGVETSACSNQDDWNNSTTDISSAGGGWGASAEAFSSVEGDSISAGGGRGGVGYGGYYGSGKAHNFNYTW